MRMEKEQMAAMIDHTLLKPEATRQEIIELCGQARTWKFFSVCVNPRFVALAQQELEGSGVQVCTVVGFPLGATTTRQKVIETLESVENGATEIDMVMAVGAAVEGDWEYVTRDIAAVRDAVGEEGILKVILETCLLSDEQIVKAVQASMAAGAEYVKTSTGFSRGGATAAHVALMRASAGPDAGVKASGGIRNLAQAREMIAAGATRLGMSAGISVLKELMEEAD